MSAEGGGKGVPALVGQQSDSLREAFGKAISRVAEEDASIVVLDADVAGGTGAHHFRKQHPDRFVQCGIAEQNMVSVASGMAHRGLKPFATTFAVFMLRALEQVRLSIAYSNANVKLIASHPGLDVGPDGASAQCQEDLACMRSIPNMVVLSPCDAHEVAAATRTLANHVGPVYMRTGRSPCPNVFDSEPEFVIGKGRVLREGNDLTLVGCGVMTARALTAAEMLAREGIEARVVNMPSIKPVDGALLMESACKTGLIVTCEDHNVVGGLGSAVAEVISERALAPVFRIGIEDVLGRSGEPDELAAHYGLDTEGVFRKTLAFYREVTSS